MQSGSERATTAPSKGMVRANRLQRTNTAHKKLLKQWSHKGFAQQFF